MEKLSISTEDHNIEINFGLGLSESTIWTPDKQSLAILKGSNFTCSECAIVSRPHKKYPHGFLNIHKNLLSGDIRVLCSMCSTCENIDRAINDEYEHGHIINCPELTQGEVVHFARMNFIAKIRGGELGEVADGVFSLMQTELTQNMGGVVPGFESGSLIEFVDIYNYLPPNLKFGENSVLKDVRYLPSFETFKTQVAFWNVAAYSKIKTV